MPEKERTQNRASVSSLLLSTRPLTLLCYESVWIFFIPPPNPLRVSRNKRRSVNENRKSNEDAGAVLSRKLHVLQPTERWNLKHPTNTELLNPAKTAKNVTLEPSDGRSSPSLSFFALIQTMREAVYSQAARTQCVHYSENSNSV